MSLMDGHLDMHTLARQIGTSIGMLKQHYSKMTATMAADRLAWMGDGPSGLSLRAGRLLWLFHGNNVDELTLARNARTSVEMVEKFYSSNLSAEMSIDLLQGRRDWARVTTPSVKKIDAWGCPGGRVTYSIVWIAQRLKSIRRICLIWPQEFFILLSIDIARDYIFTCYKLNFIWFICQLHIRFTTFIYIIHNFK